MVTLIPKKEEARTIRDYRPVSCCSTPYKIISKILTYRLGKVIGSIINGELISAMPTKHGLRQWDPISPLLVVLFMEYLNRCFHKMKKNLDYNYHSQCEKVNITNLSFADDLLLFARGDIISVDLIMKTIHSFSAATRLKMNASKCKIYFGSMDENTKQEIKLLTGFSEGPLPFRYLGVPITTRKLNCHHYTSLVEKIVGRITHWSARLLSYAGRIQLLKSITFAVTNYWMQCFPLPKHVIHKIDAICRSFIWTGGKEISIKSPISRDKVCRPKCNGGMNLISLQI
ncbi:uncharacterized protein LOC131660760 [Vicia villosa]|uniref:uncharacterized protein LOC131660760 n=1 Tax=Vicia villosa TaxID=3911 RepID=UPI00273BCCE5|nr:uncharacterized protein LOC131660760 [Vicia villosa]